MTLQYVDFEFKKKDKLKHVQLNENSTLEIAITLMCFLINI